MGRHVALSPNTPSYHPSPEERAYLERLAANPSEPKAERARLLLVAAQKQACSELKRVEANKVGAMLRALRRGHSLEDALTASWNVLWRDMSKIGHKPPPDPSHDEIMEAISNATSPWRKKLCEAVRLRLIVGLNGKVTAEQLGTSRSMVGAAVNMARKLGAAWVAEHGLAGPMKRAPRSVGRQIAQRERVAEIHARLTSQLRRHPTAQELMDAAGYNARATARVAAERYGLPLSRDRQPKRTDA